MLAMMAADMRSLGSALVHADVIHSDARTCAGVEDKSVDLVVCSPPYANNYDYADATRLELTFFREIQGWGDLQQLVRRHLMRSCTQHVTDRANTLSDAISTELLDPIRSELESVTQNLADVRLTKGGRKAYHLMVGSYFADMAHVWKALRRVCKPSASIHMVIGDSAPYGVYVPVVEWNGVLAKSAGFDSWSFEKIRDRNTKWKNRKHRVPLLEGRLVVGGATNG
jgi:DNA modification methylase